jgi:hypothetical protein
VPHGKIYEHCVRPSPGLQTAGALRSNPLNVFERIAIAEHYDFERVGADEIHINLPGQWTDHDVSLTWNSSDEALQLFLIFEGRLPGGRTDDICRLMSLINERLAAGHFDFWNKNKAMVYRNSQSLRGGAQLKTEQALDMIALALDAAERGYPACQYVIWAGKSPEDALTAALVDLAANA